MKCKDVSKHKVTCPYCEHEMTDQAAVGHVNIPRPGDCSLCIRCAEAGIFTDDFGLRKPTEGERRLLETDEHVKGIQRRIRDANRRPRIDSEGRIEV